MRSLLHFAFRHMQAIPLAGNGVAILETGITDIDLTHIGELGQLPRDLIAIHPALFHPQPQVFALTLRRVAQVLFHLKILWRLPQHTACGGWTKGIRKFDSCRVSVHKLLLSFNGDQRAAGRE